MTMRLASDYSLSNTLVNLCLYVCATQMTQWRQKICCKKVLFAYLNTCINLSLKARLKRRIVVNVALKHLQKKRIHFSEIKDDSNNDPQLPSYAYSSLGQEELMKLINALPDGYRIVFNLNIIEGYSHEEIADMLGIQASTSRSQLVKARKMLQSQILQLEKIAV